MLDIVLDKIEAAQPKHATSLRKRLAAMGADYLASAERHYADYDEIMRRGGRSIDFGVQCYLKLWADMRTERSNFLHTGRYSNTSYKEVERQIYQKPEMMEYHMHGLAMAQFLWLDQYERLVFFRENLPAFREKTRSYLEIGGGHGLYTREALAILRFDTRLDLLDISESSLELARQMIGSSRVNYILKDIFEWEIGDKYDFITIAEVIEHVEKPAEMLARVKQLLRPDGVVFITTPVNAPMIDHIYLFNNVQEIRDLLTGSGFNITMEKYVIADGVSEQQAAQHKIPVMYAAFLNCAG